MRAIVQTLIFMMSAFLLLSVGSAQAFQDKVDWIWNDTNAVPRGNCRKFVVQAGPPQVLRGKTSGRDCLKHAIRAYHEGDHEEAVGWILAGQCHDRETRMALVRQAPNVLGYVLEKYGPQVP
ncbi:MAG: hypothetical protein V3U33_05390 [candidate division NC10 bacterium]